MATCLFCDSTKLTKEHVWPKWLIQQFPMRKRQAVHSVQNVPTHTWLTETLELTAKLVCKECNTGWMGAIEGAARPIITPLLRFHGRRFFLYDESIVTIAAWVTLRSMIFDTMLEEQAFYTREDRLAFRDSDPLEPLPRSHIWLALHQGRPYDVSLSVRSSTHHESGARIHLSAFYCGEFAVQFFTSGEDFPDFHSTELWMHEATTTLWPIAPTDRVGYPPDYHIDNRDWERFVARFLRRYSESGSSSSPSDTPLDPPAE